MLNILVTGGAGFIGSHLVDLLLSKGYNVKVIDNLSNGNKNNLKEHFANEMFEFFEESILDEKVLEEITVDVDTVYHLATLGVRHSIKYPLENHMVNSHGTLLLLRSCRKNKIKKFIHCSSSEVYGTALTAPMDENHPTFPHTIYGGSKLSGESYARAYFDTYQFPTVILRPFNIYGPRSHFEGDAGELIPKSFVRALTGRSPVVFGDGLQTRDFTYVKDSAHAIYLASQYDNLIGGTFNIGSDFEISIKEVVTLITGLVDRSLGVDYLENRPGDVLRLYANSKKFKEITGWKRTLSFDEGLEHTYQWFKKYKETNHQLLKNEVGINWT